MTKQNDALATALAKAKALQPKLGAATDELNRKITAFEKALTALGLGVVARVHLYGGEDERTETGIEFSKWGDAWRLLVVDIHDEDEDRSLLLNESRQVRLDAVELFPRLIEALVAEAEAEVGRVKTAADSVDEVIATLTESKE